MVLLSVVFLACWTSGNLLLVQGMMSLVAVLRQSLSA